MAYGARHLLKDADKKSGWPAKALNAPAIFVACLLVVFCSISRHYSSRMKYLTILAVSMLHLTASRRWRDRHPHKGHADRKPTGPLNRANTGGILNIRRKVPL